MLEGPVAVSVALGTGAIGGGLTVWLLKDIRKTVRDTHAALVAHDNSVRLTVNDLDRDRERDEEGRRIQMEMRDYIRDMNTNMNRIATILERRNNGQSPGHAGT